jgi:hypothetical protein
VIDALMRSLPSIEILKFVCFLCWEKKFQRAISGQMILHTNQNLLEICCTKVLSIPFSDAMHHAKVAYELHIL